MEKLWYRLSVWLDGLEESDSIAYTFHKYKVPYRVLKNNKCQYGVFIANTKEKITPKKMKSITGYKLVKYFDGKIEYNI